MRDRGPGIPDYAEGQGVREVLFARAAAQPKKSTGLGLAFVKEIAELHRGRVELVNAPRGGALATLTLPLLSHH